jgi:hypothetical protein
VACVVCVMCVVCGWTVASAVSENSNDGLGPERARVDERGLRVDMRGPRGQGGRHVAAGASHGSH